MNTIHLYLPIIAISKQPSTESELVILFPGARTPDLQVTTDYGSVIYILLQLRTEMTYITPRPPVTV